MGSQLTLVGFSAGGTCTVQGQLLILKGRSWHSPKSAIEFDCTRKFHLPRPVSTGWRARLFLPPPPPPPGPDVV